MSSAARIAGKIHKWLALLMAVQILFWFLTGLFFAAVPIERVRSEHVRAEAPTRLVSTREAGAGLGRIGAILPSARRIELKTLGGRPVAMIDVDGTRPALFDLDTGRRLSPLGARDATRLAEADLATPARARRAVWIDAASPEYRGPLPAWRVDFETGTSRSIYVAADTGAVAARRSTLWRTYDFLWSLHIMDYRGHEDFNTPLLIAATLLGLIVIGTGIVLFPTRLGWTAWLRRRQARRTP